MTLTSQNDLIKNSGETKASDRRTWQICFDQKQYDQMVGSGLQSAPIIYWVERFALGLTDRGMFANPVNQVRAGGMLTQLSLWQREGKTNYPQALDMVFEYLDYLYGEFGGITEEPSETGSALRVLTDVLQELFTDMLGREALASQDASLKG